MSNSIFQNVERPKGYQKKNDFDPKNPFGNVERPSGYKKPMTASSEIATGIGKGALDIAGMGALALYPVEKVLGMQDSGKIQTKSQEEASNREHSILKKIQSGEKPSFYDILELSGDEDIVRPINQGTSLGNVQKTQEAIPEGGVVQDIARRFTRSAPAAYLGAAELGRTLVAEGSGLFAKEGLKAMGAPKSVQEYADMGAGFLSGFAMQGTARQFSTRLLNATEASIPQNAQVATHTLSFELEALRRRMVGHGKMTPAKTAIIADVDELLARSNHGMMNPVDLVDFYRDGNLEMGRRLYGVSGAQRGAHYIGEYQQSIRNVLELYGHQNPSFLQLFRTSNSAFHGIMQSRRATNYIRNILGPSNLKNISKGALSLFGVDVFQKVATGASILNPKTAAIGVGLIGGLKMGEMMHRVVMNPVLREFYFNTILNASRQNATKTVQSLGKFDSELKKEKMVK